MAIKREDFSIAEQWLTEALQKYDTEAQSSVPKADIMDRLALAKSKTGTISSIQHCKECNVNASKFCLIDLKYRMIHPSHSQNLV